VKESKRLDLAKAAGPSGLGNAHLKAVFLRDDELAENYGTYLNRICGGKVSERLRHLLVAGICVPLPKPGGKVRPVVIPSATLRFTGRVGMKRHRTDFEKFFLHSHARVKQYAVGVEQGGELMYRFVHDTLEAYPDLMAIATDAAAAFQMFDRAAIWASLEARFPELAAEVKFIYGIPSEILLADSDLGDAVSVLNEVGARQGCPFGTFLFALVLHPILIQVADEFPTLEIASFADDAWFIATPEVCAAAQARYKYLYMRDLCGELNDSKSVAFSFGVTEAAARAAGLSADFPWATAELPDGTTALGGVKLMGAPLGSDDFIDQYLEAALARNQEVLLRSAYSSAGRTAWSSSAPPSQSDSCTSNVSSLSTHRSACPSRGATTTP